MSFATQALAIRVRDSPACEPRESPHQDYHRLAVSDDHDLLQSSDIIGASSEEEESESPSPIVSSPLLRELLLLSAQRAMRLASRPVDADILSRKLQRLRIANLLGGEPFNHAPLDLAATSIRLLEVLPGHGKNGRIRCKLRHATTAADYTCLSYVWGPQDDMHHITINGKLFRVGNNLWEFLKMVNAECTRMTNLGMPTTSKQESNRLVFDLVSASHALWIDALCIDQENNLERNHQVEQMGQIYGNARQVFTWLGYNTRHSAPLFHRLRKSHDDELLSSECGLSSSITWFYSNEYWTRAWITQEIVLARQVFMLAGRDAVDLVDVFHHLNKPSSDIQSIRKPAWQIPVSMTIGGNLTENTLLRNFALFRDKECRDVRDKLYSLLSISRSTPEIKVDYNKPAIDLAFQLLKSGGSSFCLCTARVILSAFGLETFTTGQHFLDFRALEIPLTKTYCKLCSSLVEPYLPEEQRKGERSPPDPHRYLMCLQCAHSDGLRSWNGDFGHIMIVRPDVKTGKAFHISTNSQGATQLTVDSGIFAKHVQERVENPAYRVSRGSKASPDPIRRPSTLRKAHDLPEYQWKVRSEQRPLGHITIAGLSSLTRIEPIPALDTQARTQWQRGIDNTCHGLLRTDHNMTPQHGWIISGTDYVVESDDSVSEGEAYDESGLDKFYADSESSEYDTESDDYSDDYSHDTFLEESLLLRMEAFNISE